MEILEKWQYLHENITEMSENGIKKTAERVLYDKCVKS